MVTGSCNRLEMELLLPGHRACGSDAGGLTGDKDRVTQCPTVLAGKCHSCSCLHKNLNLCAVCSAVFWAPQTGGSSVNPSPSLGSVVRQLKMRRAGLSTTQPDFFQNCTENLPNMVKPLWTWTGNTVSHRRFQIDAFMLLKHQTFSF